MSEIEQLREESVGRLRLIPAGAGEPRGSRRVADLPAVDPRGCGGAALARSFVSRVIG